MVIRLISLRFLGNKIRYYCLPIIFIMSLVFVCKSYLYTTKFSVKLKSYDVQYQENRETFDQNISKLLYFGEVRDDQDANFQWCPYQQKSDQDYIEEGLDCDELFRGKNETVLEKAKHWESPCTFYDSDIMNITENCREFRESFPFRWPADERSKIGDFPIAYVLLVAEYAEQVVRLLQSIYRPWNLYCIAYDNDTDSDFQKSMHNLNRCFENIILPKTFLHVNWAGFSILNSVMNCAKVLNNHANAWRYVQILSWNDFPLKTNEEMVRIMQIFNGSQDAELNRAQVERYRRYYKESDLDETKNSLKKSLPPGNIVVYKGSMAATLSREFINFTLTSSVARQFYKWSKTAWAPEEQYFSTLVHNLHTGVPGGFPGTCLSYYEFEKTRKRFVSRYQVWYGNCKGRLTSASCVFGVGDLRRLQKRFDLVAHKFYLDFQPATYYCMSKVHFQRTFNISNYRRLNVNFYRQLPAVRYHHSKNKNKFPC